MKRRNKKSGYVFQRGDWWHVRFRVDGKDVYVPLETTDHKAAKAKAAELAPKFAGGTQDAIDALRGALARLEGKSQDAGVMLRDAWRLYLASRSRPASGPRTLAGYAGQLEAFKAFAGDVALRDIERKRAEEYVAHMESKRLSSGTINKHVGFLKLLWNVLLPESGNPWNRLSAAYKTPTVGHSTFTDDMMRKILNTPTPEPELGLVLWVMAYTGLRLGDACNLRVENCDLSRGVIEVYPAKTRNRGKDPLQAKVGIHRALLPIIAGRINGRVSGELFPAMARSHARDVSAICNAIQIHLESCGISTQATNAVGRRVAVLSAHSFRHTLQSALVRAGVDVEVRQKIICHKGGISQRYSHISDSQVIEAIERAMPDLRVGCEVIELRKVG